MEVAVSAKAPHPAARPRMRGALLTRLAARPPVLMYHGVGRPLGGPSALFVTPGRFARQMRVLARLGLRGVSLGELGDAVVAGRPHGLVGLTFDDGYREVLTSAAPVLRRHGFTGTFFVVSGLLGGGNDWDPPPRRELLTAAEVRTLAALGHEIGSHGATHARLTGLGPAGLRREITGSREGLERLLGRVPRSFCYPYGAVDEAVVRAVAGAGYSYACAVQRVPGLPAALARPRIGVGEGDHGARLAAKLLLRGR